MSKVLVSIVTNNEEDYFEYCLKHIYDFADKIVIVHGEAHDESPTDLTHTGNVVSGFSDPESKLIKRYLPTSYPQKKDLALNLAKEEGFDWYFTLDADEFYTNGDLRRIRCLLDSDKDHDMFTMEYFSFCYNFSTGYWDTVDPAYPVSERIWRNVEGMYTKSNHCERFFDRDGKPMKGSSRSRKLTVSDDEIMMYHMTFVKNKEKIRERMIQRLGTLDAVNYVENILYALTPDNKEEIYLENIAVRGVYGIHWCFDNVVLGPFSGRGMPEVLSEHPRKDIEWEV